MIFVISAHWFFLQNKKSPIFFSFGSHFLLRLHIFLSGPYSYEQQAGEETQPERHLKTLNCKGKRIRDENPIHSSIIDVSTTFDPLITLRSCVCSLTKVSS